MSGTVLITGSTGGLGSAIAKRLATDGYHLALHFHQHPEKAEELRASLPVNGKPHILLQADLRKEEDINQLYTSLKEQGVKIGILINNAGVPSSGLSWKQSPEEWSEVFQVNTTAPWLMSRQAIPMMREIGSGRIIYLSSVVAHRPPVGTGAYAASKAALEGLTRAQAIELARFAITVNCIAPGYYNAGMIDAVEPDIRKEIENNTPLQRLGLSEELAASIAYLCSKEAAFTTGQVIHINGGLYI